jgi:hypothetical protein
LLERGLSNWQALGIVGLLCLMTGGAATAAIILRSDGLAWIIAISVLVLLVRLRVFGHYELSLIKLSLRAGVERVMHGFLTLTGRRGATPAGGVSFDAAWQNLTREAQQWAATRLEVQLGRDGELAEHVWDNPDLTADPACQWTFGLSVEQPQGGVCRMRVVGTQSGSTDLWYLSRVARVLRAFGQHWSAQAAITQNHEADAPILKLADFEPAKLRERYKAAA